MKHCISRKSVYIDISHVLNKALESLVFVCYSQPLLSEERARGLSRIRHIPTRDCHAWWRHKYQCGEIQSGTHTQSPVQQECTRQRVCIFFVALSLAMGMGTVTVSLRGLEPAVPLSALCSSRVLGHKSNPSQRKEVLFSWVLGSHGFSSEAIETGSFAGVSLSQFWCFVNCVWERYFVKRELSFHFVIVLESTIPFESPTCCLCRSGPLSPSPGDALALLVLGCGVLLCIGEPLLVFSMFLCIAGSTQRSW